VFVPEKYQKGVERDIKALLTKGLNGRIKIRVMAARGETQDVEFFVNLSLNKMKKAEGLVLSTNMQQTHE
jgi:hypothetical protein